MRKFKVFNTLGPQWRETHKETQETTNNDQKLLTLDENSDSNPVIKKQKAQ